MSTSMKKVLAKAKKVMHPNSRKSIAITKKTKKITNREKQKLGNAMKQNLIGEKMIWIKENMMADVCPYTPQLTADLLQRYVNRNDAELEQISIKHSIGGRKNRQHASREDIIRMTKKREENEYETCGIEIPDILNPVYCEMLRKWDGELRYLTNFKFTRFGRNNLAKSIVRNKTTTTAAAVKKPTFEKIINANSKKLKTLEANDDKNNVNESIVPEEKTCSMDVG